MIRVVAGSDANKNFSRPRPTVAPARGKRGALPPFTL